jgi:hypothetical protein
MLNPAVCNTWILPLPPPAIYFKLVYFLIFKVTAGLVIRNKLNILEAAYCIASQILGSIMAGCVYFALDANKWSNVGNPEVFGIFIKL